MCCNNGNWGTIIIAVIIAYLLINRFDRCGCDNGCSSSYNNGCNNGCNNGGYLGNNGCGCH